MGEYFWPQIYQKGSMPMQIKEISNIPERLRRAYLSALPEPQDLFVENLVKAGQKMLICDKENPIGYAVIHDATVVEFFVVDEAVSLLGAAFELALKESKAVKVLCKTFDPLMVTAAASQPARTRTEGFLFRKIVNAGFTDDPEITARPGSRDDIARLLSIHDGFFDDVSEIETYINTGGLFFYVAKDEDLLGCGIFKRIIPEQSNFDIGMVVAPAHRRKGLGAHIVGHLKNHCLRAGYRPVCGCSVENIASRRSLEKAGFATTHSLVEFTY